MSALSVVNRVIQHIVSHPTTHTIARHVLKVAAQELIRHVRRTSRSRTSGAF